MMETSPLFGLLQENFFHPPPDAKNSHIGIRHSQPGVAAKVGDVSDAGKPVQ